MQSKIEGIPEGFELLRIGGAKKGELFIACDGEVIEASGDTLSKCYSIVRRIAPPDPGEGWRWVEKNETIVKGDEYFANGKWVSCGPAIIGDRFCEVENAGLLPAFQTQFVRRRLPRYRPFANAAEFEPHRDRWIQQKTGHRGRVTGYTENCVFHSDKSVSWDHLFKHCVFDDDGTPCGVLVE